MSSLSRAIVIGLVLIAVVIVVYKSIPIISATQDVVTKTNQQTATTQSAIDELLKNQ